MYSCSYCEWGKQEVGRPAVVVVVMISTCIGYVNKQLYISV